ncbi:MAG: thiol-disulfide oxidoreductase DCC family protein [Roseinatronobacter sp.]
MTKDILYNGQCPICSTEIDHYKAAAQACNAPLRFVDLNQTDLADWGLDAESAARRLHVRDHTGALVTGVAAFAAIWQDLPRWRWLARLVMAPGLRHVLDWGYERIAAPLLFKMHQRRQAARR